ncbi:hypothetical protein O0535_10045 [Brevibacillus halotolerans]|uniref:Uncharacterized protein n=1 Tax=Brevibacillus halotolerans TaxID=1507437 RepID=A0ABT4HXL3_9BACL|nr:hypothetical protein [Brevibacillus halotolerans]
MKQKLPPPQLPQNDVLIWQFLLRIVILQSIHICLSGVGLRLGKSKLGSRLQKK